MQIPGETSLSLDYPLLDDLLLGTSIGARGHDAALRNAQTRCLGPLVELACFQQQTGAPSVPMHSLSASPALRALLEALRASAPPRTTRLDPSPAELIRTLRDPSDPADDAWHAFCFRAQRAAQASGLPLRVAQGLAAALQEIEDNVHAHSERAATGLVGYRTDEAEFEFVVADAGIGVLESLRKCRTYDDLADSGTALRMAIADGESRFGHESGHGYGFRPLFTGLANLYGHVRLRSGDHVLVVDGRNPERPKARVMQRAGLCGLLVSVRCLSRLQDRDGNAESPTHRRP